MQQEGHFVPWQGLGNDPEPLVATCLETPSNSIIVLYPSPRWTKNLKRLVSAIETENLKNLKTAVHRVIFFFSSDASWLSPGRSTRSIACCRDE